MAQAAAQLGESRQIIGQCRRNINIFIGVLRDHFLQTQVAHLAHAHAADMRVAREHHNWNAHPQRVACGGGAVIWKWIKPNINGVVARHVFAMRSVAAQRIHALLLNAMTHEDVLNQLAHVCRIHSLVLDHQLRIGHAQQNARPRGQHIRGHFAEHIKTSKRDMAAAQRRQRRNIRTL